MIANFFQGFKFNLTNSFSGYAKLFSNFLQLPQEFEKQVQSAQSIMEFYFSQAFSQFDSSTAKGKKEIAKVLLPHIKKISNKIEKAHWVEELSRGLAVPAMSIWEEMKQFRTPAPTFQSESRPPTQGRSVGDRKQLLVERLLVILLKYPQTFPALSFDNLEDNFPHLVLKSELEFIKDPLKEIKYCLQEIKSHSLKDELQEINLAIKNAEVEKKEKEIENLVNQFHQLSQELNRLLKI